MPVVGKIPTDIFSLPEKMPEMPLFSVLLLPAFMIALVGYVESISVAQTFASLRHDSIDPNRELVALGGANIAASVVGGMPVAGGFSRSAVNYQSGARSRMAGVFAGIGIAVTTKYFAPLLFNLPRAVLAATIIVAVINLIDIKTIRNTLRYSRKDGIACVVTVVFTLLAGVEMGILSGVVISIGFFLHHTANPHLAVVGLVPGTEHFRNVLRHRVELDPHVLSVRLDENLYFANSQFFEKKIKALVSENRDLEHVVLQCSAINDIDTSALHSLETINKRLIAQGIKFHLSEVKGPVMDRLRLSDFLDKLSGSVFLSQYDAFEHLSASERFVESKPEISEGVTERL